MRTRIGIFFAWLGMVLLLLFAISAAGKSAHFEYLLFSIISGVIAYILIHRDHTPSPPSQRFSLLRRLGRKKSKETKEN